MSSLYEIAERYKNLEELLDNSDENVQQILLQGLDEIQGEFNDKALNIVKWIKNIGGEIKAFKEEEKRLNESRKALENKEESLKEYLFSAMSSLGLKKADLGLFKLNIQKNAPSVEVLNLDLIDEKYLIPQEPKIDKKAIKEDFKNGIEVKGCEIKQGESLRIR